jgi:hypothetical protein
LLNYIKEEEEEEEEEEENRKKKKIRSDVPDGFCGLSPTTHFLIKRKERKKDMCWFCVLHE